MQGPVSGAVLCIREIGDPYVILNSFPRGKKSRPLSIIVQRGRVSPPVHLGRIDYLRKLFKFSIFSLEGIYAEFVSMSSSRMFLCLDEREERSPPHTEGSPEGIVN